MNLPLRLSVLSILLTSLCWPQQGRKKPLFVLVEQVGTHTSYHVDSEDVTSDPLRGLGRAIEKRGNDWPVIVAVDSRLSINTLGNAVGLVGKAGFVNVRYYIFHQGTRRMGEISFGKVIPFPSQEK